MSVRRWLAALCILLFLLPMPAWAEAEDAQTQPEEKPSISLEEGTQRVLERLDFSRWVQTLSGSELAVAHFDVVALIGSLARGEYRLDGASAVQLIGALLLESVQGSLPLLVRLMAPAILCGILTRMQSAFESKGVSEISHFACFLLLASAIIGDFTGQAMAARLAIENMISFMQAIFPTLLLLLAAVGGTASSQVMGPAVLGAAGIAGSVLKEGVLGVSLLCAGLTVLDNLGEIRVEKLLVLAKSLAKWTLGICFTVFVGVLTVQGAAAASFDGVSLRTAKYAVDNFIPVVGSMFADTMDTLVGCALVVKNAVGVAGLCSLVLLCMSPVIKLAASILCYRLAAALLEPVADSRIVRCLNDFSGVLSLLCVTVMCCAAMFFLVVALMLMTGNITTMMR